MAESGLVGYPGPLKAGDVYHVPQEYEGIYVSDEAQRLIELEQRVKELEERLSPTQVSVEKKGWQGPGVYTREEEFCVAIRVEKKEDINCDAILRWGDHYTWYDSDDLIGFVRPLTTEEILTFVNTGDISHIPECR